MADWLRARANHLGKGGPAPALTIAITAFLLLGVNCPLSDEGRGTVLIFVNATSTRVTISAAGEPEPFDIVDAGETRRSIDAPNVAGECTESALVARNEEGEEVDRRPPPLCDGQTWIIEVD